MDSVLNKIQRLAPQVRYESGEMFFWSPEKQLITYHSEQLRSEHGRWSLLHETAHALLNHTHYDTDFELLQLEVEAWQKAKDLAPHIDTAISDDHIQDCLDTYRDWLHQRSTCPACATVSLQETSAQYRCHNCNTIWQVSASRFCRPYRLRNKNLQSKKSPEKITQTTFA